MAVPSSLDPLARDPAVVSTRLIESALELARAEAKLALTHTRAVVVRAVTALLAVLIATSFAQVALVLLAISPLLLAGNHALALGLALGPALLFTAIASVLALRSFRSLDPRTPPRES